MDTIDIAPTPFEYARIATVIIEGAYELDTHGLTGYQVLWAFQAAEQAALRIDDTLGELPRRLGRELLRLYLTRALRQPPHELTRDTSYAELNGPDDPR